MWIQRGLAALFLLILLFFVFAPSSRAMERMPNPGSDDRAIHARFGPMPAQRHFHTTMTGVTRDQTSHPS